MIILQIPLYIIHYQQQTQELFSLEWYQVHIIQIESLDEKHAYIC